MTLAEGVQSQPCRFYIVHSILPQVDVAKEGSCVLPRRQARGSRWRLGMIRIKIAKEIFFLSFAIMVYCAWAKFANLSSSFFTGGETDYAARLWALGR